MNAWVIHSYTSLFRISFKVGLIGLIGLLVTLTLTGKTQPEILGFFAVLYVIGSKWFCGLLIVGFITGYLKEVFK